MQDEAVEGGGEGRGEGGGPEVTEVQRERGRNTETQGRIGQRFPPSLPSSLCSFIFVPFGKTLMEEYPFSHRNNRSNQCAQ